MVSVTPWAVDHKDPLSMGFPKQEYWSRLPFPPPRDLPDQGLNLLLEKTLESPLDCKEIESVNLKGNQP